MKQPQVWILIMDFNQKETTLECIGSLEKVSYPNYEILLVDNSSFLDLYNTVTKEFPFVKVVKNGNKSQIDILSELSKRGIYY